MTAVLSYVKKTALDVLRKEDAQDTFEYLLIIGGVSAVILALMFTTVPGLFSDVLHGTCVAVDAVIDVSCAD